MGGWDTPSRSAVRPKRDGAGEQAVPTLGEAALCGPPLMGDVTTAEARKNLADLLNRVAYAGERVTVTRRGREIAAIVPAEDAALSEKLRQFLAHDDVARALDQLSEGRAASWSDLKAELGL